MTKMITILCVLLAFQSCTDAVADNIKSPAEADSSLVTIESTYTDLITKKQIKVRGTGFIVQANEQFFVLTASHVSQGEALQISANGQVFEIINRYYPRKSDIELIELKPTPQLKTAFNYQDTAVIYQADKATLFRQIDSQSFVLKNSWVKDVNLDTDNTYVTKNPSQITCDMYCITLSSESLIQPGYSGSPLITKLAEPLVDPDGKISFDLREGFDIQNVRGKYFLRGLAIKRDRFFAQSTFISSRVILSTIKEFLTKKPAFNDEKEANAWILNSNVLIRKVSYDVFEAAALGGVVGNGVSVDGGDDLLTTTNDSPLEMMRKITAFPATAEQEERLFWIMMTRSRAGQMLSAVSWFDAETYQYVKRFNMSVRPEKEDFRQLFFQRLFNLDTKKPIVSVDQSSKIIFAEKGVQIQVNGKIPFSFSLKLDGKICHSSPEVCTEKFYPLVEVLANDQKTWLIVDLRLLMFYDIATGIKNRYNDSALQKLTDADYNKFVDHAMFEDMNTLNLRYRKKQNLNRVLSIEELRSDSVI